LAERLTFDGKRNALGGYLPNGNKACGFLALFY
jgi:hypothetical protein